MDFSSIIYKNLRHNFKKYMAVFFVNSFIVAVIFMYGSLLFNDVIIKEMGRNVIFESVKIAFSIMVLFSICFISYTTISFIKYRGKEFGVYLTLGMTTKNLRRMLFLENIVITITSLITGLLTGLIFSRIFYMIVRKILNIKNNIYDISYKTFLLSIGVFLIIFIVSLVFSNIYIYRMSIIDVIKSSSKKEVGKTRGIIGLISLILFIIGLWLFPEILFDKIFAKNNIALGLAIGLTFVCPYFIIGTFISLIKDIMKLFPKLYNNKLLVLSNLYHRFSAYKNVLYMVSILVGGAMFFIGATYSFYKMVGQQNEWLNPYDIMFIESEKYNKIDHKDIEKVIEANGGKVDKYGVLEIMQVPEYRRFDGNIMLYDESQFVISESNFNKHMNEKLEVKPDELIQMTAYSERHNKFTGGDIILGLDDGDKLKERKKMFKEQHQVDEKKFLDTINSEDMIIFLQDKRPYKSSAFINSHDNYEFSTTPTFIIHDMNYEKVKSKLGKDRLVKSHVINLKKGDKEKIFNAIVDELRKVNGLSKEQWVINKETLNKAKGVDAYRPVFKYEILRRNLEDQGFNFFTMIFMGSIFLISSGVVLYHKIITDIDNEKERIESINKIGVTNKEIRKVIATELKIIFFIPVIIGCGLGTYYLYVTFADFTYRNLIMKNVYEVVGVYTLIQIIFYFVSKRKYLNEVL